MSGFLGEGAFNVSELRRDTGWDLYVKILEFGDAVSVLILTILTASQAPLVSLDLLFLRHDLRYVLIRLRALSANSGNCLVQESIMA